MKKALLLFVILSFACIIAYAQTTVFSDDFSANQSTSWTTSGQIGSSAFYINVSGADWGGRRNTSPSQLELTNDASATGNVAGWVFANTATSGFSSPYNTTLSSNPGLVTWSFNIRQIRTDPAGYASSAYGAAFILATTSQSANNTGTGYAIVYGQSGSTDPIRLARYSGGLSTGLTNIITSNTTGLTDFGANYISCKVTYDPSNDQWELFLRDDGASAFTDPLSGTLTSQGTATDNTYTSTSLAYMGSYWQGSTSANQTAFFDNIVVSVTGTVTAPTTQATNVSFNNIQQTQMDVSWTNGDGLKRIVIMNTTNSFTNPSDGTDPTADASWNNAGEQVAYNNNGSSFTVTGLSAATTYWFRVYEYNGTGTGTLYLTSTATNNPNSQITASSAVVPTVTTAAITSITASSAAGGGDVTSDGGASVTAKGVCWNTTGTPTLADSYTTDGSGLGSYTSTISPLSASQLYYVRAYATNSVGTAYGDEVQFTTLKAEPTNHVSSFTAALGTPSSHNVVLSWTDAAKVTPDGYLIKGSTVSYDGIVAPTDGAAESNGTLVRNVTQGTQSWTFTGIYPNTTVYFKIYPYTNSGSQINYKTDETVPQASATTDPQTWPEDFEVGTKTSYVAGYVTCSMGEWYMDQALLGTTVGSDMMNGSKSVRIRYDGTTHGSITMNWDKTGGLGTVSFYYARANFTGDRTGNSPTFVVEYSQDSINWSLVGSETSLTDVDELTLFSADINVEGSGKVRIRQTGGDSGKRWNVDDFSITDYEEFVPVVLSSFTAIVTAQNYVALHWTTQSETNVQGYYIYRNTSSDLNSATRINALITAANTSTENNYVFTDEEVQTGNTYYYWLQNLDFGGSFDFHGPISIILPINGNDVPPLIPTMTELLDAYPNPFNPETRIRYTVKNAGDVRIDIYNNRGQLIRSFSQNHAKAGYFQISWDGRDMNGRAVSSGIYYYRMTSGKYTSSKKVVLMK